MSEKILAKGILPDKDIDYEPINLGPSLSHVPNYGVWHLNIKQAAELVVLDMWYSGEFPDIEEPEDWDGSENDPRLKALLASQVELFEKRLGIAADNGKLKTAVILRDFDERLNFEETYIEYSDLRDWLDEHGYHGGDAFSDWEDKELEILSQICNEIAFLRASIKKGSLIRSIAVMGMLAKSGNIDETKVSEISAAYKATIIENQQLKERLNASLSNQTTKLDRPLSTRPRRTLLTIIGALCSHIGIDPQARGAAQRIKELTEKLGASIDDET